MNKITKKRKEDSKTVKTIYRSDGSIILETVEENLTLEEALNSEGFSYGEESLTKNTFPVYEPSLEDLEKED